MKKTENKRKSDVNSLSNNKKSGLSKSEKKSINKEKLDIGSVSGLKKTSYLSHFASLESNCCLKPAEPYSLSKTSGLNDYQGAISNNAHLDFSGSFHKSGFYLNRLSPIKQKIPNNKLNANSGLDGNQNSLFLNSNFSDFDLDKPNCNSGLSITSGLSKSSGGLSNNNFELDFYKIVFSRAGKNKNAIISQRQEKELAGLLDGRVHWFSGATFYEKSDLSSALFRVEAKTTFNQKKIAIKTSDLLKIARESITDDKVAMLSFKLNNDHFGIVKKNDVLSLVQTLSPETSLIMLGKTKMANTQATFTKEKLDLIKNSEERENEVVYLSTVFGDTEYYTICISFFIKIQDLYKNKMSEKNGASENN